MTNDYCPSADLEVLATTAELQGSIYSSSSSQHMTGYCGNSWFFHHLTDEYNTLCMYLLYSLKQDQQLRLHFPNFLLLLFFFHGKKYLCVNDTIIAQALQNMASCPIHVIAIFCVYRQLRTPGSSLGFF